MKTASIFTLAALLLATAPALPQNAQRGGDGQRGGNAQGGGNAQRGGGNPQRGPAVPSRPTPHWPDGRLNLGAPPGEKGLWAPVGIVQVSVNAKAVNRAGANTHLPDNIKIEDVPFQPWARALHEAREAAFESDEPHTRCK